MNRGNFLWPASGTGDELASLLDEAANQASNACSGSAAEIVENYLGWGSSQTRMLRGRLSTADLSRLITTPRYWATVGSPGPVGPTLHAVSEELTHQARVLREVAMAVRAAAEAWRAKDGQYLSLVLVDTNFWIEHDGSFAAINWHDLIASSEGPSSPSLGDELRLVVPILVVDELDGLTHKSQLRQKAVGVTRYLYGLLGKNSSAPVTIAEEGGGRGAVTMQLLFDPYGHSRLPISDDELIERTIALRDFLGIPARQTFFLTYDTGAAFRAQHAGLMPRLLPKAASK